MALTSWKAFYFFDVSTVRLPQGEGSISLEQAKVSSTTTGSSHLIVGTPTGTVHLLDQTFKATLSWPAHESRSVTHLKQLHSQPYLVSLAEDLSREPELKVWDLNQLDRKSKQPKCLCTLTVQNGRKSFPVSALSVCSDMAQMAVGFGNGAVTVVRGDFIHDRGTKQRTVFESDEPVTALQFREANTTILYIGTTSRILALTILGRGQGSPVRTLDEVGCAIGCMSLDATSNEIIVARDDAIYAFGARGKVATYAYEGAKSLVGVKKDYILVVSPPNNTLSRSAPLHAFSGTQAMEKLNTSTFTILDADLKFIAHSEALTTPVQSFFSLGEDIYLLMVDGKLYRYHEKTFQQKLEILFQRNFFVLAISLAQKYKADVNQQNLIFRRYGDFLYQKGDFDVAMQQYLRAIESTEPSQVIRKFLDNQRIQNLIEYLEELHEHHRATPDHTTLLLNCYAKLKDAKKLEEFIKQPGELKFDLDTAIVMCRQGGYYDQAAFLARRHNDHGTVVDILIEDLRKHEEALAYIVRLEPQEAYANLMKHGTILLEYCPKDCTDVLIDYFTGKFRPRKDAVIVQDVPVQAESGRLSTVAKTAVQNLAALIPLPNMSVTPALASPPNGEKIATPTQAQVVESIASTDEVEYAIPKPRHAFSSFVDHPAEFIVFLEACIAADRVNTDDRTDLSTTLFEIYLQQANTSKDEEKARWEHKARSLIQANNLPIDASNLLLLSDLGRFQDGTVLVSERQGRRSDVFRSYTTARDTPGAIKALRKYGPEEPQLYLAALAYFTSSAQILEEAGGEIDAVLQKIDADNLMSPLQVIQTLSASSVAKMGLVKKYLRTSVERERAEIAANRRFISSYRTDTAQKIKDIDDLSNKPASFSNTARCSSCLTSLDLPAVHFLCKHSFHQRCLNIADGQEVDHVECPVCIEPNSTVRQIRQAQKESAGRHELFLDALGRSNDRFETISDWFGRGVMGSSMTAE